MPAATAQVRFTLRALRTSYRSDRSEMTDCLRLNLAFCDGCHLIRIGSQPLEVPARARRQTHCPGGGNLSLNHRQLYSSQRPEPTSPTIIHSPIDPRGPAHELSHHRQRLPSRGQPEVVLLRRPVCVPRRDQCPWYKPETSFTSVSLPPLRGSRRSRAARRRLMRWGVEAGTA